MDDLIVPDLTSKEKVAAKKFPALGGSPIPVDHYVSPEIFEKEREKIFKKHWLFVGRTEYLQKPGDYFVQELEIAQTSVLIVRGKDNKIRGFHNVCRHRANRVTSGRGNCRY